MAMAKISARLTFAFSAVLFLQGLTDGMAECTGGQTWHDCGLDCNSTCQEPNPYCTELCVPRCQCPLDRPLLHNGKCIAETDCGAKSTKDVEPKECKGGQVWEECGSNCTSTCEDPDPQCSDSCVPRCQCPSDLPMLQNGQCISDYACDSDEEDDELTFEETMLEECLGQGQVWEDCGSNCTSTCDEPSPACSESCVPRCQCPSDQPLWQNGECIREEACQRRLTASILV